MISPFHHAGMIGAGIVGFIAGAVAFGLLSVSSVGLIFAPPASGAGYALISGISASAIPSELWRQVFCIFGGLLVGVTAYKRLSVPASPRLA